MRYTVTKQRLEVVGEIWVLPGAKAAITRDLREYDLANMDPSDRTSVSHWVRCNMGDFSRVLDFRANFHVHNRHIVHDWKNPESECLFADCMGGDNE